MCLLGMPPLPLSIVVLALTACGSDRDSAPPAPQPTAPPGRVSQLDARFTSAIETAGRAYQRWGRVSERIEVALVPCSPGDRDASLPPRIHASRAPESAHGKKLFYLWTNDRAAYSSDRALANGFAVVKESFRAHLVPAEQQPRGLGSSIPAARIDRQWWTPGEPSGLFVMTKIGELEGTDAGWIYGTIVDGTVWSAGHVASCAGCHQDAAHERLFGVPSLAGMR